MKQILPILLPVAFFIISCNKNPSSPPGSQSAIVINGISKTSARVGDTITITGSGFTSACIVRVGASQVNVIAVTANSISFIVPGNIGPGRVTVGLNGTSADAGTLSLPARALYAFRQSSLLTSATNELVRINTTTGKIEDSINLDKYYLYQNNYKNGVYYGPTNELLFLYASDAYNGITKINLTTKQVTNLVIKGNSNTSFSPLMVMNNKLYTVRYYYNQPIPAQVLDIDVTTGATTIVASFDKGYSPVYNFVSAYTPLNTVVGLFASDTTEYWLTANVNTGIVKSTPLVPGFDNASQPTNGLTFSLSGDSLYQIAEGVFPGINYLTTRLCVINPLNGNASSYISYGTINVSENILFFYPIDGQHIMGVDDYILSGVDNIRLWQADQATNSITYQPLYVNPAWFTYSYYCFVYF